MFYVLLSYKPLPADLRWWKPWVAAYSTDGLPVDFDALIPLFTPSMAVTHASSHGQRGEKNLRSPEAYATDGVG